MTFPLILSQFNKPIPVLLSLVYQPWMVELIRNHIVGVWRHTTNHGSDYSDGSRCRIGTGALTLITCQRHFFMSADNHCKQFVTQIRSWGYKTFIILNSAEHEIYPANKFIHLLAIFMSSWNFVLSWVEHEKSFISPGPGLTECISWYLAISSFSTVSVNYNTEF